MVRDDVAGEAAVYREAMSGRVEMPEDPVLRGAIADYIALLEHYNPLQNQLTPASIVAIGLDAGPVVFRAAVDALVYLAAQQVEQKRQALCMLRNPRAWLLKRIEFCRREMAKIEPGLDAGGNGPHGGRRAAPASSGRLSTKAAAPSEQERLQDFADEFGVKVAE